GVDLCPMTHRIRQIGERDRVLGADIATGAAVTAERASWLGDAGRIDAGLETNGDWRADGRCPERCSRTHERTKLDHLRRSRVSGRLQPPCGPRIAFVQ